MKKTDGAQCESVLNAKVEKYKQEDGNEEATHSVKKRRGKCKWECSLQFYLK